MNQVKGNYGTFQFENTVFHGHNSKIISNNSIIYGHNNKIYGDNNQVIGHNNTLYGKPGLINGNNNNVFPKKTPAFSLKTKTKIPPQNFVSRLNQRSSAPQVPQCIMM